MIEYLNKYIKKIVDHGLSNNNDPIIGILDDKIYWNRVSKNHDLYNNIFNITGCGALLIIPPATPYNKIINSITGDDKEEWIIPEDCESRTFLHKIPIVRELDPAILSKKLLESKGIISPTLGIISAASLTLDQAFANCSSIFFALYVKFFNDIAMQINKDKIENTKIDIAISAIKSYSAFLESLKMPEFSKGPFKNNWEVNKAISEAGSATVKFRLVDSFFGNVSYKLQNKIYISQTGSSLDELSEHIDPCPIDNSSCTALTASSEFSAHKEILLKGSRKAILHGHPKFTVIMSMICDKRDNCKNNQECYKLCSEKRFLDDIPIIPGEVGTGPYGLCNTLPPAIKNNRGTIVYGHGLFTMGENDFTDAFNNLYKIEKTAMNKYLQILNEKNSDLINN